MEAIVTIILASWKTLFFWVLTFIVVFSLLSKLCACNPKQPLYRKDAVVDLLYCFIIPVFTRFVRVFFVGIGVTFIFFGQSQETIRHYIMNGFGPLSTIPIWGQAAIIFLISDVMLYWLHRWFHQKAMWRFHAIHHSSTRVDWLSTYRFHPVNVWLSFTLVDACMILVGFSPIAISLMAGFNTMYSAMVHANLNWTFGPFKHIFASPVFHRWHHTAQAEGMDKNFAPTFPLLDIVFGTFYMPDNRLPEHYGAPGNDIPEDFLGQLIWPFKSEK